MISGQYKYAISRVYEDLSLQTGYLSNNIRRMVSNPIAFRGAYSFGPSECNRNNVRPVTAFRTNFSRFSLPLQFQL